MVVDTLRNLTLKKLNEAEPPIQVKFYKDNFASHVRIGLSIRNEWKCKNPSAKKTYNVPGEIMVEVQAQRVIIHITKESGFEYWHDKVLCTFEESIEIEEDDPNEMLTPEELLKLGLYTAI